MGEGPLIRSKDTLEAEARRFTRRLRKAFAEAIAEDARGFKRRVRLLVSSGLPPFPGRPPESAVTLATELREKELPWQEIYPQAIRDHRDMDKFKRRCAEYNLRSAVRSRRNAVRRRKRQQGFIAQGNPT